MSTESETSRIDKLNRASSLLASKLRALLLSVRPHPWKAGILSLLCGLFFLWTAKIDASLPYPANGDERMLANSALSVLQEGDWNPHFFKYPSLPIYGASAGLAVGAVRAASHKELRQISDIKSVMGPYYSHPRVMRTARQAFSLVGLIGLWAIGVAAALGAKASALRVVGPAIAFLSPMLSRQAWEYLNVDIWATTATALSLAWLMATFHRRGFVAKALVPGILVGAAAASKYNAGVVLFPCLFAVIL